MCGRRLRHSCCVGVFLSGPLYWRGRTLGRLSPLLARVLRCRHGSLGCLPRHIRLLDGGGARPPPPLLRCSPFYVVARVGAYLLGSPRSVLPARLVRYARGSACARAPLGCPPPLAPPACFAPLVTLWVGRACAVPSVWRPSTQRKPAPSLPPCALRRRLLPPPVPPPPPALREVRGSQVVPARPQPSPCGVSISAVPVA